MLGTGLAASLALSPIQALFLALCHRSLALAPPFLYRSSIECEYTYLCSNLSYAEILIWKDKTVILYCTKSFVKLYQYLFVVVVEGI